MILFYRENPSLYLTHGRTDREAKEELLNELGKRVYMQANEIQKMWRSLRVQFNTCKKNGNTNWKFYEQLSFLSIETDVQSSETQAVGCIEPQINQSDNTLDSVNLTKDVDSPTTNDDLNEMSDNQHSVSVSSTSGNHGQSHSSQQYEDEQSDGFSQQNRGRNTEDEISFSDLKSFEQFLQSRHNQRKEVNGCLKEISATLKESTGPIFSGFSFAISLLKGLPEALIKKKVLDFIKECDYTAEAYKASHDY